MINGFGRLYCRDCRDAEGNFISALDASDNCSWCLAHYRICDNPKYIGRLFHGFRRTTAYEAWKAGSSIEECKEITGHKTDAMFRRYADLFSEEEKRERQRKAQERRHEYRETQDAKVVPIRKAGVQ